MSTERRTYRPFDVPVALERFLSDSRLLVASSEEDYVEPSSRRLVGDAELRTGDFALQLARDDESFEELAAAALEGAEAFPEDVVELVVIVSSAYLKTTEIAVRKPLSQIDRVVALTNGSPVRPFRAVYHGCDVEAYLVLATELEQVSLQPWRKGTWLGRARFELRTGMDGVGFNVLPLTDENRSEFSLPPKALRYVALDLSPLEASSASTVNLYVDSELLARLRRQPSKDWAKAFSDQLAVDVLSAIALRAVADREIHDATWNTVEETLLGALIVMVDGNTGGDEAETGRRRQALLEQLRDRPNRFVALIEGVCEMRDAGKRIVGGGW